MSKVTRGPDGRPWSFSDLPAESFPIRMEARLDSPTGSILWTRIIEPYTAVDIPPTQGYEGRIGILMWYADDPVPIWQPPLTRAEAEAHIERRIKESQA